LDGADFLTECEIREREEQVRKNLSLDPKYREKYCKTIRLRTQIEHLVSKFENRIRVNY
jgi:hypothetical protein